LVAALNPQQLAASLEHMALKWRELKGGETEERQTHRPSAGDNQLPRPHTRTYTGAPHTPQEITAEINRKRPDMGRGGGLVSPSTAAEGPAETRPRRTPAAHRPTSHDHRRVGGRCHGRR